jgi:malonyl-CoA O-methyltransferase
MPVDKTAIKRSFAAANASYDKAASLQRTVGLRLLDALDPQQLNGTVLDLGCGTGFLTTAVLQRAAPASLLALDIALPMLQTTKAKLAAQHPLAYVCADAEHLPLATQSLDSVVSNLALQWCPQLAAVFADLRRTLKPDGLLAFSTFGPQTLNELKTAWASVDNYHHVNDFYSPEQLQTFLHATGYRQIDITRQVIVTPYATVLDLMHELKQLGAHHVISQRKPHLTTKSALHAMTAAYPKTANGQVLATFEIIYGVARG